MRDVVLAFDFGGTKLAVGAADARTGEWLDIRRCATPADADGSLAAVERLARTLVADLGSAPQAIGVSFGGHVDSTTGVVRRSMQVPGWEGKPLARLLSEAFQTPTVVYNDATGGAIGEWASGAGKGLSDFAYITVSTGVGGGLILRDEPYEGTAGFAAEFGHLPVRGATELCTCGLTGCLESQASGPAIARHARARVDAGEPSMLAEQGDGLTARDVSFAAARGDRLAASVLAHAGHAVGEIVSSLVISLDPQAVLIGGGVAHAAEPFWTSLRDAVVAPLRMDRWVRVGPAKHIDEAPLYGARAIALELVRDDLAGLPSASINSQRR